MADYASAKYKFKMVVLYSELVGAGVEQQSGGRDGKSALVRQARADYVRAYSRDGDVMQASEDFSKVATKPEDRFTMMKQLAELYYDDGEDREAAITFNRLIKEKPLSPESPGFQAKIVDCVLRMGKKERTAEQVRRLVKIIKEVEASGIKDDKDRKLLGEANEQAERSLFNLATTWHNEASKTRDEETFKWADAIYGDYLTLFPEGSKAYDMRFRWAELLNDNLGNYEKAAMNYTLVVLQDAKVLNAGDAKGAPMPGKPGKWLTQAAYKAVLAYDKVAQATGEKRPLRDACKRYLKYVPEGERLAEGALRATRICSS
jgi:TolA-binding protein